ncbi:hypothetical protein [Herbiconiux liukaitaii]|uniref:hypothetical protein n=1 Tax=Herbiconiux liukaitaii TaxID=3342799 RepID=UPI0035BA9429
MMDRDERNFEVEARWKEEVYYWEGERGFLFDAGWGVEPPVLYVPTAEDWEACTPPWMHGRRDLILSRLDGFARHRLREGPYPASQRGLTRER